MVAKYARALFLLLSRAVHARSNIHPAQTFVVAATLYEFRATCDDHAPTSPRRLGFPRKIMTQQRSQDSSTPRPPIVAETEWASRASMPGGYRNIRRVRVKITLGTYLYQRPVAVSLGNTGLTIWTYLQTCCRGESPAPAVCGVISSPPPHQPSMRPFLSDYASR